MKKCFRTIKNFVWQINVSNLGFEDKKFFVGKKNNVADLMALNCKFRYRINLIIKLNLRWQINALILKVRDKN